MSTPDVRQAYDTDVMLTPPTPKESHVKQPNEEARRRIDLLLSKVFLELDVDPNDVVAMTVSPEGFTFTIEVPMRVELGKA